jgi:hypothetical protein
MKYIIACLYSISLSVSLLFANDLKAPINQSQKRILEATNLDLFKSEEVSDLRFLNFLSIFEGLAKKEKWQRIQFPVPVAMKVYEREKDENGNFLYLYLVYSEKVVFNFPSLEDVNTAKEMEKKVKQFYEQLQKELKSKELNKIFTKIKGKNRKLEAIHMGIYDKVQSIKRKGIIIQSCQSALVGCAIEDLKNINLEKRGENLLFGLISLEYAIYYGTEFRKYVNIRFDSPGIGGSGYDFEDYYFRHDHSNLDEKFAFERTLDVYEQVIARGYKTEEERQELVRELFDRMK